MADVVGIDYPVMDFLVNLDRLPATNGGAGLIDSSWQGGGNVATAMVTLARLGGNCGIIANIGSDLYGDVIEWDFKRHGVDTSRLKRSDGYRTAFSLVLSERETAGRSIVYRRGSEPTLDGNDYDYLRRAKYLHVPGVGGVFGEAVDIVRGAGGSVAVDAGDYSDATMDKMNDIDVLIASEFFFNKVSDDGDIEACCRRMRRMGPQTVVFTFGERGSAGIGPDGVFFNEPAFAVPATDTVGAGDVYHGAFLFGLLRGLCARECARLANAVSAVKVTRIGGRAAIPDHITLQKFLETGAIDYDEIDERVEWYSNALENTIKETGKFIK